MKVFGSRESQGRGGVPSVTLKEYRLLPGPEDLRLVGRAGVQQWRFIGKRAAPSARINAATDLNPLKRQDCRTVAHKAARKTCRTSSNGGLLTGERTCPTRRDVHDSLSERHMPGVWG